MYKLGGDCIYITKKELLQETGISYGQLYRWKREGLIPDDWFIKQSSFTGQETVLPRQKILGRVKLILELKERYSLEELAQMFSAEITQRIFTRDNLKMINEISPEILSELSSLNKSTFTFFEIVLMIALSGCSLDSQSAADCFKGLAKGANEIKTMDYNLHIAKLNGNAYGLLSRTGSEVLLDDRFKVELIHLEDVSHRVRTKYHTLYKLLDER